MTPKKSDKKSRKRTATSSTRSRKKPRDSKAPVSGRASKIELCLLIALAALPYLSVVDGPFVYDDTAYVVDNYQVTQPGYALQSLTTSYPPGRESQGLYRPLVTLSYALDHLIAGLNPMMFHLTNILLHVAATLAAFFLLRAWIPSIALQAAILFAVHPVHSEAVSWIVGRAELLCGLLMFLAIRFATNRLPLAMVLLLLALMSKEMAITTPFLAVLPVVFLNKPQRAGRMAFLGLMAVLLMYLGIRATILGGLTPEGTQQLLGDANFFERIPAMFVVLTEYLRLSFAPISMSIDYAWTTVPSWSMPSAWIGLLLFVALATASWRLRKRAPWLPVAFAWFVIALIPVSHFFPIGASYAERFLYIPSLGICLAIAALLSQIPSRRVATAILVVLVVVSCVRIVFRNQDWRDEERFYQVSIAASPDNATLRNNLGRLYADRKNFDAATRLFEEAVTLSGENAPALSNLGIMRAEQGRVPEAQKLMEKSIRVDPSYVRGYLNLARLYAMQGRPRDAREALEEVLILSPGNAVATNALRSLVQP